MQQNDGSAGDDDCSAGGGGELRGASVLSDPASTCPCDGRGSSCVGMVIMFFVFTTSLFRI